MASIQVSRRSQASRRNGKLGGIATAQNHSQEWLEARASKAGTATRDKYGKDIYRHLNSLRPVNKSTKEIQQEVIAEILPSNTSKLPSSTKLIQLAAKALDL